MLLSLTLSAAAGAQPCSSPAGGLRRLSAVALEHRLQFLHATLSNQATQTRYWNRAFPILGGAVAGSQAALAVTTSQTGRAGQPNARAAYWLNAIRGVLGVALTMNRRLRIVLPAPSLAADPCQRLALAEAALQATAQRQAAEQAPTRHLLIGGVSLASALILGLGFNEWRRGWASGALFLAGGELRYWTQPTGAIEAWNQYRRDQFGSPSGRPVGAPSSWLERRALSLRIQF